MQRGAGEAHDDFAERYQEEIGQLVWSHPAITHSHYKNSQGKVFTLSPWPLDQYWEWTRTSTATTTCSTVRDGSLLQIAPGRGPENNFR